MCLSIIFSFLGLIHGFTFVFLESLGVVENLLDNEIAPEMASALELPNFFSGA